MIGDVLSGRGISRPLYEYYESYILPLACWQEQRFSFQGIVFLELVGWLSHGLYHLQGVDAYRLDAQEKMHYKAKILDGKYGWDYMLLLNPIKVPTKNVVDVQSTEYREWNKMMERRQWALNNILTGGDGRFIPAGII